MRPNLPLPLLLLAADKTCLSPPRTAFGHKQQTQTLQFAVVLKRSRNLSFAFEFEFELQFTFRIRNFRKLLLSFTIY